MGFLDNTSITVDAILTKKGRELLSRGQNEFRITKFALADDEVDYNLWDTSHPNGSNYYGAVIENMPLLEAFVDENQLMRYKLTTLPQNTTLIPSLSLPFSTLSFVGGGKEQVITPVTTNGNDSAYVFTLFNSDVANLTLGASSTPSFKANPNKPGLQLELDEFEVLAGATSAVTTNDNTQARTVTVTGKSAKLISKTLQADQNTNLSITGVTSGAQIIIPITVNKA